MAAGAAVDAKNEVMRGVGGGVGEGWVAEHSSACPLDFIFCASRIMGLRSLPGLARRLVTLLRCKRGNVTDYPAN